MITGKEYAALPQMDAPTFYGMRLAMFEALKDLKAGEHAHPPIAITKESAAHALRAESAKEPYLHAAGTQEIVARYFEHIVGASSDQKLKAFADSFTDKQIQDADKALKSGSFIDKAENMGQLMHFNKAAKECFHMNSLTESLVDYFHTDGAKLEDITVRNGSLTKQQADRLSVMDRDFRIIDVLTPPTVQQHIRTFHPADYVRGVSLLEDARRMGSNFVIARDDGISPKGPHHHYEPLAPLSGYLYAGLGGPSHTPVIEILPDSQQQKLAHQAVPNHVTVMPLATHGAVSAKHAKGL